MTYLVSALVLLILFAGFKVRVVSRAWHYRLMLTAFSLDLALLLYVELSRDAINTVLGSSSPIVLFHASVSTGVLACYLGMIILGVRVLRGNGAILVFHRRLAILFITLRLTNFVTAFFV